MNQWQAIGLPRCRSCRRLIWPWQEPGSIIISADGTDPPVDFEEMFHLECSNKASRFVAAKGGVSVEEAKRRGEMRR